MRNLTFGVLLLGSTFALAGCGGSQASTTAEPPPAARIEARFGTPVEYAPPGPVTGFPESQETLYGYLARGDEASIRRHAWSAWAALTARSNSGLPVFLTWYQNAEIFGEGTLQNPRVLTPRILVGGPDSFGDGNPPTECNLYNQAYRDHVRANGYQWRETLQALVGKQSNVVDFPPEAMVVKTVWWPVRHDGLTAFPVWDNEPTRPLDWGTGVGQLVDRGFFGTLSPEQAAELKSHEKHGNEWGVFRRVVAIDPTSSLPPGLTTEVAFFDPDDLGYQRIVTRQARVVPLDRFFLVQLNDADTVQRLNQGLMGQVAQSFWGRPLTQEDSLALVAAHVTTREASDWVWATFWWHDEPRGPYGVDVPASVAPPFDQFRMNTTLSADLPRESDQSPRVTFNPYLEAGFALGPLSNCIGCHQQAGWTANGPQDSFPVHRGTIPDDDPEFENELRTHFLWSLVFRPRPQGRELNPTGQRGFLPDP